MNPPATSAPPMSNAGFLRAFEALALPPADFRHADHLRAAWCCFRYSDDFSSGAARFVQSFRRYVGKIGAGSKYHETITWFYLALVFERIALSPGDGWNEFRARNPDLFDRTMPRLKASYRPETLQSPLARRVFLLPDAVVDSPY